MLTPFSRK